MRKSAGLALAVSAGLVLASAASAGTLGGSGYVQAPSLGPPLTRVQYYDDHYRRHCYRRCARYDYYHHCVYYERYCED
jgi:hypothetical protein